MPISVSCPSCAKALRVKDEWAGRRAKCPGCGEEFIVPAPADVVATPTVEPAPAAVRRGGAGGTVYDPVAAAAAKAKRERENWDAMREEGAPRHLPWQFVLLGFFYFGAIFAGMMVYQSFVPTSGMRDRTISTVRTYGIPYLVLGVGATPFLLRSGARSYGWLNAARAPSPRGPRLMKWSIVVAMGVTAALLNFPFAIYAGVIIAGLLCIVAILVAPDI